MEFNTKQSIEAIAKLISAEIVGDCTLLVSGINEIHRVKVGEIVFVDHPKYYEKALKCDASVVLINKKIDCPANKVLLISENPFRDFNFLNAHFGELQDFKSENQNVKIGENTFIHPSVIMGNNVTIGHNCHIAPYVILGDRTHIGNNVIIQSGSILGGDAFYFKKENNRYIKMLSIGHIVIEDDVEIGVNCTIDRGVTDITHIKKGSKLDNQIQIGHDTIIGENCLIASQVGIAGCCNIQDEVIIWGQVGIASGKTVGKNAVLLGKTGVNKNLEGGKTYFGNLAEEFREYLKKEVKLKNL